MPNLSRRAQVATEAVVVAALVAASLWYGNFAARHAAVPPDYHYLSPAISVAVGKGFHSPMPVPGSPLDDFLSRRTLTLDWNEAAAMAVGAPDRFHETTRHLINTVGYWWRMVGISWTSIGAVGAALHAMAVVGTYALARLFLPLPLAVIAAAWMCTSTIQLALVPHVRDYSKGAFIIAVLPLVAALTLRPLSRRAALACAAAAGALIGTGLGFKMDVAIMAPLALVSILLLRGRRPWAGLAEKAQIAGVLMLALLVCGGPLLYRLSEGGSNSFHVVLLGFTDGFDANLGIDRSVYAFLPFYSDDYVAKVIQSYSGAAQWLQGPSPEYDAAGRALFTDLVRTFPADMLARGLGAANAVMNLCFLGRDPSFLIQPLPLQDALVSLYSALNRLNGWGAVLALVFVIVASWGHLRRGVFAAITLLVLAGYPALQFESRHYFHAQIAPVIALVAVSRAVLLAVGGGFRQRRVPRLTTTPARSPLISIATPIVVILILIVVPLTTLRAYQSRGVERALSTYLDTRVPLQTEAVAGANGSWLVRWPQAAPSPSAGGIRAAHYVVEFEDAGGGAPTHVGVRYDAVSAASDYSRVLSLPAVSGPNRIGFSVFPVDGQSDFAGIELSAAARARLSGVYRAASGGPAGLPLDVRLPADWRDRPLYQRLHLEPRDERVLAGQLVTCANGPGCKGLLSYLDRWPGSATPAPTDAIGMIHSPIVHPAGGPIEVDGRAEDESSYLFQLKEHTASGPGAFVAEGHLHEGGVLIGLLKDRAWAGQALVRTPGPFVVIVPVNDPGEYMPMITNAMSPGQRVNRFSITRAGFIDAVP